LKWNPRVRKLTVQATEHRATIAALPIDPVEAEPRQVFFSILPISR
jgi:hypothetical protein